MTDLIESASNAYKQIAGYDQQQVDDLIRAIGWTIYREEHAESIAKTAHEETGLGNKADKKQKIQRCCKGVFTDIIDEQSVGVRKTESPNIIEIMKPVGVIGTSIPSTNPGTTIVNVAMLAVKGRNSIVISSPPHCVNTAALTVQYVREALADAGAPRNLIQLLPVPVNRNREYELMEHVDLVQVTGSSRKVKAGQESGTPNYCVGEGNIVAIVDETADVREAATDIVTGTTFDNSIVCVCENAVVAHADVYSKLIAALEAEGGYLCTETEAKSIEATMFLSDSINPLVIGKSAREIAEKANVSVSNKTDLIMVEESGVGAAHPLSGEKLAPVLTMYQADTFEDAVTTTKQILDYQGTGHSCVIHTTSPDRTEQVGREVDVCRVAVNQSGIDIATSFRNDLTNTAALGAGPWGGNQLDENLSYERFITSTRIALPTDQKEPIDDVFGNDETTDI
ncbi:aldehyde dehydrogenase family protein [Halocatena halophila]|uniref:aldehyde dehydrogenase family protein n=1 Tax=Halocatena halophila TaxID=2814576 RepID=UPI002ECFBC95